MAYYNICPYCKGHLDPGEHCDCRDRDKPVEHRTVRIVYSDPGKGKRHAAG